MQNTCSIDLTKEPKIAYFSMEIGIQNDIPTYSGGLGVLAGDTITGRRRPEASDGCGHPPHKKGIFHTGTGRSRTYRPNCLSRGIRTNI